jgi:hypothetical protein
MAWGKKQKEALAKLFDEGLADPKANNKDDIELYYDLDPAFEACSEDRFAANFRNFAAEWMMGKGLQGVRRRKFVSFVCHFIHL